MSAIVVEFIEKTRANARADLSCSERNERIKRVIYSVAASDELLFCFDETVIKRVLESAFDKLMALGEICDYVVIMPQIDGSNITVQIAYKFENSEFFYFAVTFRYPSTDITG